MTAIRTPLLIALLTAGALGSTGAAAQPGPGHHHHHHFPADVDAFHGVLAPIWHAAPGKARNRDACRQAGRMLELAQAIRSVDSGKLQASAGVLRDRCGKGRSSGNGDVEAALFDLHEEFHHLIGAGAGN